MSLVIHTASRNVIVAAAKEAILQTRDEGFAVSKDLERRLMKVARTAPEFAIGTWFIMDRCGCLLGNLIGDTIESRDLTAAEFHVGVAFDVNLMDTLQVESEPIGDYLVQVS